MLMVNPWWLFLWVVKPQFFGHPLPTLPKHPSPKPFLWAHGAAAAHVALPPQELRLQELSRALKAWGKMSISRAKTEGTMPKNWGGITKDRRNSSKHRQGLHRFHNPIVSSLSVPTKCGIRKAWIDLGKRIGWCGCFAVQNCHDQDLTRTNLIH